MVADPSRPAPAGAKPRLLALTLGLLLAFFIGETLARLIFPAPLAWKYPQVRFRAADSLIFALVPNQRSYTADKAVSTNERGLRGPLVSYARPPNTLRILFLGDSVTFGYGVTEKNAVSSQLEKILSGEGVKAQVINAAVPAYNTIQEVSFLRQNGILYQPDWVLLGFYWNDVNDKSTVRVTHRGDLVSNRSDLRKAETFAVRLRESRGWYSLRNLFKRSRLLYGAATRWRILTRSGGEPSDHRQLRTNVFSGYSTPRTEQGWRRIDAALTELKSLADKEGFRPLIVIWPAPQSLEQDFGHTGFPARLLEITEAHRLPVLDLEPVFREHYSGHDSLFIPYDADHPNAQGHFIAAQAISGLISSIHQPG